MGEFLHGLSSGTIAFTSLALMLLVMGAGYRAGRRSQASSTTESRSQITAVLASLLGIIQVSSQSLFDLKKPIDAEDSR